MVLTVQIPQLLFARRRMHVSLARAKTSEFLYLLRFYTRRIKALDIVYCRKKRFWRNIFLR